MRRRFTPEEHIVVGKKLKRARSDLLNIARAVGNAYGKAEARKFLKAAEALTDLRACLEGKLGHEIEGDTVQGIHVFDVYFGRVDGDERYEGRAELGCRWHHA
jgi:hypothetical protein